MAAVSFDPDFASPADWAAMYRDCGLQVVPCHPPAAGASWKRPRLADWKSLQGELIPDATFARWYGVSGEHAASPQMGFLTGAASGNIFVIDLDDHKSDTARLWWEGTLLVGNMGIEPETWQQRTGGGGRQLLFRGPPGWRAPTNRTAIKVDIRGQGGFAVLPPSLHESGRNYDWVPGYAPWECDLADAPHWLIDAVESLVEAHGGHQEGEPVTRTASPATDFDAFGARVDGREDHMTRLVWGAVVDWWRECPIRPPAAESEARMRDAYAVYERSVKSRLDGADKSALLEREGRGISLFRAKWQRAMGKWDGEVAAAGRDRPAEPAPPAKAIEDLRAAVIPADTAAPMAGFGYLDIPAIKALPDARWIVKGMIPEDGLGFFYGPPGHGKTFVALDLALHVAYGMTDWWWGSTIERHGLVVYVAREGLAGLKNRIEAWQRTFGIAEDEAPFALVRAPMNLMNADDVGKLLATIEAAQTGLHAPPVLIIVDTVSRVMPGADENLQKEMTLFVAACDLLREKFAATVIGVHHAGKNGDMRGSTVLKGAGDFVFKIEKDDGDGQHGRVGFEAEKIKDAEDGWAKPIELAVVEWTAEGVIDGARKSLIARPLEERAEKAEGETGWPSKETCRQVIQAIGEAWQVGRPWSTKVQTREEGRYGPRLMFTRWRVAMPMAAEMLETWLMNGVLAVEMADRKTKKMGLKVVGGID